MPSHLQIRVGEGLYEGWYVAPRYVEMTCSDNAVPPGPHKMITIIESPDDTCYWNIAIAGAQPVYSYGIQAEASQKWLVTDLYPKQPFRLTDSPAARSVWKISLVRDNRVIIAGPGEYNPYGYFQNACWKIIPTKSQGPVLGLTWVKGSPCNPQETDNRAITFEIVGNLQL
ncbi:MAG: hypothetical protein JWP89_6144 [Schlesneria sp.]|nr:hypothetical protein [Schlesneria sp.]